MTDRILPIILLFCTLLIWRPLQAAGGKPVDHPLPLELQTALTELLNQQLPDGGFVISVRENELTAGYRTRSFLVYDGAKTGEYSEQPREVIGPRADGFYLHVTIENPERPHAIDNLFFVTETQEPYWKRKAQAFRLTDSAGLLFMSFDYGPRTRRELLFSIPRYVAVYAAPRKLPEDLETRRRKLLADADTTIRTGLLKLTKGYPQLNTTNRGSLEKDLAANPARQDRLGFDVGHYNGKGGPREDIENTKTFMVLVVIQQHTALNAIGPQQQLGIFPLYPHILLGGQIQASAGDPALDKALKQLVKEALEPLTKMDEEVGKGKK